MKNIFVFLLIFCSPFYGHSIDKYWIGNAGTNFNTASNWSTSSGGSPNTTVPGTSDVAIFDGGKNTKCVITATMSVQGIEMRSGYTDSLVLNSGSTTATMAIGSAGFNIQNGTFRSFTAGKTGPSTLTVTGAVTISGGHFMGYNGPTAAVAQTFQGNFTLSGGTFTASKNTTNFQSGMIKSGGTFAYNTGSTVNFQGKLSNSGIFTIDFNNTAVNFNNVTFTTQSQWDMVANIASGSKIVVNGNMTISHNSAYKSEINTGTVEVLGNLTVSGNGLETGGGTGTIVIKGTGTQTITGSGTALKSPLPNISIEKTAGTLNLSSVITCKKNFALASTATVAPTPGTSTVVFTGNEGAIVDNSGSVNFTFYNLTVNDVAGSGSTTTLVVPTSCSVSNTLNIAGASQVFINGGTILVNDSGVAKGVNLTNTNTTGGGGTATIELTYTSSNNQYLNGNVAGTGFLPNVRVNKPGGNVSIKDVVCINGTLTLDGTSNYGVIKNGTTAGKIKLFGNLNVPLASKANGGTATIEISGTGDQSIIGSTTAGTGKLCRININKPSGNLTLTDVINLNALFEYKQGTIVHSIGEVIRVYAVDTLDLQGTSNNMSFQSVSFESGTSKITGKLTVLGDLTIKSSTTLNSNGFDIELGGQWDNSGTFTTSAGKVIFANTTQKSIKGSGTQTFSNLQMNGNGGVLLTTNTIVTGNLQLSNGILTSTGSALLTLNDNATASGMSNASYVAGPMKKVGNDNFVFPIGKNGKLNPITISAPTVITDAFQAEYFDTQQSIDNDFSSDLQGISSCEHWSLTRTAGTSTVKITLGWNSSTCDKPEDLLNAAIAYYQSSSSSWIDLSPYTTTGNILEGTVQTINNIGAFGYFTLANKTVVSPTYASLVKTLDGGYYRAQNGKIYVKYNEEYRNAAFTVTYNVYNMQGEKVYTNFSTPITITKFGENYLIFDFSSNGLCLPSDNYYVLEIISAKQEKYYLRFYNYGGGICPAE